MSVGVLPSLSARLAAFCLLLSVVVSLCLAEPLIFPDSQLLARNKDRTSTTAAPRPAVVVRNTQRNSQLKYKQRYGGGVSQRPSSPLAHNPNRKKQLTEYSSSPRQPAFRRYEDHEDQQQRSAKVSVPTADGAPTQPSAVEQFPTTDKDGSSVERLLITTKDGVPVVDISGGVRQARCPQPDGKFPVMRHCDKYMVCSFNIGYLRSCAPGTQYNHRSRICDFPYRVQCADDFNLYRGSDVDDVDLSAAASSLPPLTPSVMERPTARLQPDGSVDTRCPVLAGLLAVPGRCDQFLNCWKGYGRPQTCPPGTLFNCKKEKCDFPANVRCVEKEKPIAPMVDVSLLGGSSSDLLMQARSRFSRVMAPPSGQRLRLRGGRKHSQGHVQLYHEGQWSYLCEDSFTSSMKDNVCRELGFTRGSRQLDRRSIHFHLDGKVRLLSLHCIGNETQTHQCEKRTREQCKPVGIGCEGNPLTSCPPRYRLFNGHCYRVHAAYPKTRQDAKRVCESDGGSLVTIETQAESDFVSELLQYTPNIGCLHTAGVGLSLFGNSLWVWETSTESIQFQKWWPGWDRRSEGHAPSPGNSTKCLILQNLYPSPPVTARSSLSSRANTSMVDSGYFWWTAAECSERLPFVCKVQQADIGCIRRDGSDYKGAASVTQLGQRCLNWTHPTLRDLTAQLTLDTDRIGDHNYCRNPDNDDRPWCFMSAHSFDYCDIPRCRDVHVGNIEGTDSVIPSVEIVETTSLEAGEHGCSDSMFKCGQGDCVYFSWVCDGDADCPNGRDEEECHQHLQDYTVTYGAKLVGADVEKWLYTANETCARHCSETKEFVCRGFNYYAKEQECYLLDSNVGLLGVVQEDAEFQLFQLKAEIPDCSQMHVCPGGKCVNRTQLCDGRRDCPDGDDEVQCHSSLDFQLRLVNGETEQEGRIEVKVFGRWGVVCDDEFTMVDADVVCRHAGFPLGAAEVVTNAGFGSGNGVFLMDNLRCRGTEQKLTDCDFNGWGQSDCTEAEVAGVRCREVGDSCRDDQWRCDNQKCIDLDYVCDLADDCGDFSDEAPQLCKRPIGIRLADGTNTTGRVEVLYKGVWGTVCDDDFEAEDAQVVCRMLGLDGSAVVHSVAMFGPGTGQIWLDQVDCIGSEKNIDECSHLPWAQTNCAHGEDVGVSCHATTGDLDIEEEVKEVVLSGAGLLPDTCGQRFTPVKPFIPLDQNAKIVNGKMTEPGAHPWMVGVRIRAGADTAHWCGAVIVSEYHILSAAHCLLDYPQEVYVLRVGDYDNQVKDLEEQEFTVERMFPHPEFNSGSYLNNDIIVIRVKAVNGSGIRFGRYVQPVCLSPPGVSYRPGRECTIAGWGSTGRNAGYARRMQSAVLPLLPISTCTSSQVYGPAKITDGMYCAGYLEGGIDTCQGDSGGPMVCEHDGTNILYGITSWGQGCARPNKPGVYTKITSYLSWIYRTLRQVA